MFIPVSNAALEKDFLDKKQCREVTEARQMLALLRLSFKLTPVVPVKDVMN